METETQTLANLLYNLNYRTMNHLTSFLQDYLEQEGYEIMNGNDEHAKYCLAQALESWASQNQKDSK